MTTETTIREKKLSGICIVEGKGLGRAHFVGRVVQHDTVENITRQDVGEQIMLFNEIRTRAKEDYRGYAKSFKGTSAFDVSILNIYEHILDDPAFIGQVVETVTSKLYNLESAIRTVSNDFIKRFNSAGTSYFKERSSDMVEICEKLISYMNAEDGKTKSFNDEMVLVVLRAFTPSDILSYDLTKVKAVLSVSGGKTSHAAILARTYGIPVVSGILNLSELIRPGDELLVDADMGTVLLNPEKPVVEEFRALEIKAAYVSKTLKDKWCRPVYTRDGVHIEVLANVSLPQDALLAVEHGCDGTGLVRTEYLLSNRKDFPSPQIQVEYYSAIFKAMGNRECVVRMMDIGGDKIPEFFKMPNEFNPFMGWRAIRILLERRDLFEEQLRSIMIAAGASKANYKIMFPMVTTLSEWLEAKAFVNEVSERLGMPVPRLGVLFEVPLAILEMNTFTSEIDFASIGTNDLLQYLSAADRNNPKVNYLYNPTEPAFLKIIRNAIEVSRDNGIPLSICGEMAGNPYNTLLLVGLGLTRFSVIPRNIPIIKELISNISFGEAAENIRHIFAIDTADSISRWIKKINKQMVGDILAKIPWAE